MSKKFVFIGAGSHNFSRSLARDILTFPAFEDCTLALVDIDPAKAQEVLGWTAGKNLEDMCRDGWNWQSKNPDGYVE